MSEPPGEPAAARRAPAPFGSAQGRLDAARAPGVHLRVMRPDDIPAGLRLTRASHWNQTRRDWELFLRLSPHGCRVAVKDSGEIVGSVTTLRFGAAFSWVAMVLVDPAHRGQGIGAQLLQEALVILEDMATVRLDATPAGHPVYNKVGFFDEFHLQRMQRIVQPLPAPSPQAPSVRIMEDRDLSEVLAQDRDVFGADRRALVLDFRERAPEYAWVCGDTRIDGYLFGRPGHAFEHMGPLVARDLATASRLVGACLAAHADRPFIIDVPLQPAWTGFLAGLGFTVQRPFFRMCRGAAPPDTDAARLFAIAGAEFA